MTIQAGQPKPDTNEGKFAESGKRSKLGTKSLKYEILFRLLPAVLVAMIVLSFLGYYTSQRIIQNSINNKMELSLSVAVEKIEKSLAKNRKVAEALALAVEANASVMDENSFKKLMPALVETNPETFGGGVWFEPYAYDPLKEYFSPYCMLENGKIIYVDNYSVGEGLFYTDQAWYVSAKDTTQSTVWSAPYYDEFTKISMVTASSPFYDAAGKFMGVATTDIDLTALQKMIVGLQVNKDDKAFLLDPSGTYVADNDSAKLLKANITGESNASLASLGKTMLERKQGTGSFEENGLNYLAWYTQIPETGWIVAISGTQTQLFGEVYTLARTLILLCAALALLVSGMLIFFVQRKVVRPLGGLVDITGRIADGDLNVKIDSRMKNEIGVVFASLQKTTERLHDYTDYINEISGIMDQISSGNLDYKLQMHYVGEFERIKRSLERIQASLSQTLFTINTAAEQVSTGALQVSGSAHSLAAGSTEQAAAIEQLSASVTHVAQQAEENLENVKLAIAYAKQASQDASSGNERMKELTGAMTNIHNASNQIDNITKTIEDIAFQTNILALNAAIEAARAGAAGKGFAVVADEVRSLASKSAEAAKQTAELIKRSVDSVAEGSKITAQTAEILQNVMVRSSLSNDGLIKIEQSSTEQVGAIGQIRQGLTQVSAIVQTNAAASEENSATSEEMSAQAAALREEVGRFRLYSQMEREADQTV